MARARRKQGVQVDAGEGKPIVKSMPSVCPLCGYSADDMLSHLQSHAPGALCQRYDGKEKGWRLDGDGARYFRTDISVCYCSNCSKYAPLEVAPQD
jgi:hypothetical protein